VVVVVLFVVVLLVVVVMVVVLLVRVWVELHCVVSTLAFVEILKLVYCLVV
jgi:hypothetical protein